MNSAELYRAMGAVDDDILLRSEAAGKKRPVLARWAALAACLCLCAAAVLMTGGLSAPEGEGGDTELDGPAAVFTPIYNAVAAPETEEDSAMCWFNIPAVFTRELTEEELDMGALAPGKLVGYMRLSGEASFDGDGTLLAATLRVATTLPENTVTLSITPEGGGESRFPAGGEVSPCNGVDYLVYEYGSGSVTLAAEAEIGGCGFFFTLETAENDLPQAKRDFAEILECFTYYGEGQPDLSAIAAGELPQWADETLPLSEARQDERFGAYLPAEAPRLGGGNREIRPLPLSHPTGGVRAGGAAGGGGRPCFRRGRADGGDGLGAGLPRR